MPMTINIDELFTTGTVPGAQQKIRYLEKDRDDAADDDDDAFGDDFYYDVDEEDDEDDESDGIEGIDLDGDGADEDEYEDEYEDVEISAEEDPFDANPVQPSPESGSDAPVAEIAGSPLDMSDISADGEERDPGDGTYRSMGIRSFFSMRNVKGIPKERIDLLIEAGFETVGDLESATDAQISLVRGMGPSKVGIIRREIEAFKNGTDVPADAQAGTGTAAAADAGIAGPSQPAVPSEPVVSRTPVQQQEDAAPSQQAAQMTHGTAPTFTEQELQQLVYQQQMLAGRIAMSSYHATMANPAKAEAMMPAPGGHGNRRKQSRTWADDDKVMEGIGSVSEYAGEDVEGARLPAWVKTMQRYLYANRSHSFLLTGNVRDYMVRNIDIPHGLVYAFDPGYGMSPDEEDSYGVIATYDIANGLVPWNPNYAVNLQEQLDLFVEKRGRPFDKPTATDYLELIWSILRNADGGALIIIDYSDLVVPDAPASAMSQQDKEIIITLDRMFRDTAIDDNGGCLILLCTDPSEMSGRLMTSTSRLEVIDIGLPDASERRDYIEHAMPRFLANGTDILAPERGGSGSDLDRRKEAFNAGDTSIATPTILTTLSAGLSYSNIEDIALTAIASNRRLDIAGIRERKNEIIRIEYNEVIEILKTDVSFDDIGGNTELKEFFRNQVVEPVLAGETSMVPMGILLSGAAGTGKSVTVSTPIPTPSGWKPASEVVPGDFLLDMHGNPTEVLGVFPQGRLECFRLVLEDGRSIECSADHLWGIGEDASETMTTAEIAETVGAGASVQIPRQGCVPYKDRFQLIGPHAFGEFLGNMHESTEREDRRLLDEYLYCSPAQRRDFLDGLASSTTGLPGRIDTGKCKDIEDHIIRIIHSLGLEPARDDDGFLVAAEGSACVAVSAVEDTGRSEEMVCFLVDNPEHMFLAGDYVPTHNTMFALAAAKESNMTCVELNLSKILDKWVGSSEHNLMRALDCTVSMAPTILFIDEIDKTLPMDQGGGGSTSDMSSRIAGKLQTFLSDQTHKGQVITIAATNYPERIPEEFKRAGRFDKRLPVMPPDVWNRIRILLKRASALGVRLELPADLPMIASFTGGEWISPDMEVPNPWASLPDKLRKGSVHFSLKVSARRTYKSWETDKPMLDSHGNPVRDADGKVKHKVIERDVPEILADVSDRAPYTSQNTADWKMTVEEFYRSFFLMFSDSMPMRGDNQSSKFVLESMDDFVLRVRDFCISGTNGIRDDSSVAALCKVPDRVLESRNESLRKQIMEIAASRIAMIADYMELYYRFFDRIFSVTEGMTGAESNVILMKAKELRDKDRFKMMRTDPEAAKAVDWNAIPFETFIEAARRTPSQVASMRRMTDNALINTNDLDFIPDAEYGKTVSGDESISYRERYDELVNRMARVDRTNE